MPISEDKKDMGFNDDGIAQDAFQDVAYIKDAFEEVPFDEYAPEHADYEKGVPQSALDQQAYVKDAFMWTSGKGKDRHDTGFEVRQHAEPIQPVSRRGSKPIITTDDVQNDFVIENDSAVQADMEDAQTEAAAAEPVFEPAARVEPEGYDGPPRITLASPFSVRSTARNDSNALSVSDAATQLQIVSHPKGDSAYLDPDMTVSLLPVPYEPVPRPQPDRRFGRAPAQRLRSTLSRGRSAAGGRSTPLGMPKMVKRLLWQVGACALIIGVIFTLKMIDKPFAKDAIASIDKALSDTVDLERGLGELLFVKNIIPDISVFSGQQAKAAEDFTLQVPISGAVKEKFTKTGEGFVRIEGEAGQVVQACARGRVLEVSLDDQGRRQVIVDHDGGIQTVYKGLSGVLVRAGEAVETGTPLALAQQQDTHSILWLAMWVDGNPVDPVNYLENTVAQGPGE